MPDAERTAHRLRALGHTPIVAPLLSVVFAEQPADLPVPAAIVVTSRNGIRALCCWPQSADWLNLPLFVTGQATADAARDAGFTDVRSADGDASDLATLVMAEIGRDARPVLYPAARDRSAGLVDELRRHGYELLVVEAYAAELDQQSDPLIRQAIASSSVDAAMFYSRRTAVAFRRLVESAGLVEGLRDMVLLVMSEQVAEPLRDFDAEVRVAGHTDEQSLLALLPRAGC